MTVTDARRHVEASLRSQLTRRVHVAGTARPPGQSRRRLPRLTLSTVAVGPEPDRWTLGLHLAVAGTATAENTIAKLVDTVDAALPATVDAPAWSVAYDGPGAQWVATATASAFRQGKP